MTDHSLITCELEVAKIPRGPGSWKLNNNLLADQMYINMINVKIDKVSTTHNYKDPEDLWELLKFELANCSREYGKQKSQKDKLYRCNLYKTLGHQWRIQDFPEEGALIPKGGAPTYYLANFSRKLHENEEILGQRGARVPRAPLRSATGHLQNESPFKHDGSYDIELENYINKINADLDSSLEQECKKAQFLSKCRWSDMGERNTKYFFGLQKRNYVNKTMYIVRKRDGTLSKDYKDILNEQQNFYEELYASNPEARFTLQNSSGIFLSQEDKMLLDAELTLEEIKNALISMKPDRTLGCDGLTREFYVKFFDKLGPHLLRLYEYCISKGRLNASARRGVIQLVPKHGMEGILVKQWCPLTILNYDYKIIARVLAMRFELVTDNLISPSQTGFLKGRNISTNIRKSEEIIAYMHKTQKKGLLVTIDYEKCFDRVEFKSIAGSLRYFGFGETFVSWIMLLYQDFTLCTQNNGYFSDFFAKTRGCSQGCPVSPTCFLYCGEVMTHLIRQNQGIKGIKVDKITEILPQFADDTTLFLDWDQTSLNELCDILTTVETNIGLRVSYDKTTLYRIGSVAKTDAKLYTTKNFKWSNDDIAMLGVYLSCDGTTVKRNFEDIVNKVKIVCEDWRNRTLTLMGKVLLVNALIGSLFVYKVSSMLYLTMDNIKVITQLINTFIWGERKARIAMSTLTKLKEHGGLRLVDPMAKQKALLIKWVFANKDPFLLECMYNNLSNTLRDQLWKCNLHKRDVKKLFGTSFWQRVLEAWFEINYQTPVCRDTVLRQCLWYNSEIRIADVPFLFAVWAKKGIMLFSDIINQETNRLLTREELYDRWGISPWLELESIKKSIPQRWFTLLDKKSTNVSNLMYDDLCNSQNVTRRVYDSLIWNKQYFLHYTIRWIEEFGVDPLQFNYEEYMRAFTNLYLSTKITKYRDFQYRLLLAKIVTNEQLFKWKIVESNKCSFCKMVPETFQHLFMKCVKTKPMWSYLWELSNENETEAYSFVNILFFKFHADPKHVVNMLATIIKQYIYRCHCNNQIPRVLQIKKEIEYLRNIEYFSSKHSHKLGNYIRKWSPLYPELLEINLIDLSHR